MSKTFSLKKISEGNTTLYVPIQKQTGKGPGIKQGIPFYNPAMELNRDLSIIVTQWLLDTATKKVHLLDGLAASGIRGIRMAQELTGDFDITINDWDEQAYKLITKNISTSGHSHSIPANMNLNHLLSQQPFQYIDIDPFGSPAYFIDSAIRSITHQGIIACTATDTATLCGVYPTVCLRRYSAHSFHSFLMKETALRILLGFLAREAAKHDKGIQPLLSYASDHYFRVYIQIKNGIRPANETTQQVATIPSDILSLKPQHKTIPVGPLWMGKLHTKNIVAELRTLLFIKHLGTKHAVWKLLSLLEEEADAPPFFYTLDDLATTLKMSPPKLKKIFEKLTDKKYMVTKTHFNPTGFKTDAPKQEIMHILQHEL
jgi:tRNA (guanine26-N2/guanine27-N2)-dimethyltransferase